VNLPLYIRVLWRFRLLMAAGALLAIAFAFLSFVRIQLHDGVKLSYRESEEWSSTVTLLVSQKGFPWGNSLISSDKVGPDPQAASDLLSAQRLAESRFSSLALIYSELADSDAVRRLRSLGERPYGKIEASALLDSSQNALPIVSIAAIADTPSRAVALAKRETSAFLAYIRQEQQKNANSPQDRVRLEVITTAGRPKRLVARPMTLPIVVFLTVMIAFVGLAFLLENLRPRAEELVVEPAPVESMPELAARAARGTASS
jgi:hypothetical protein